MRPLDLEQQAIRSTAGLRNLVDRTAPWLFEVGSWIFGGLTALNLVIIGALITVGPADVAIRISTTLFACALPLNIAGLCLLRLMKDTQEIGLDDLTLEAFQAARFPHIEAYFPPPGHRQSTRQRRARVVLRCALGMAVLSLALTLAGLVMAMWHMAWWVGTALLVMTLLSAVGVTLVLGLSNPPETAAEQELTRRHAEHGAQPAPPGPGGRASG